MKLNDIPIAWIHIITIITWKGPSLSSTRQFNAKGPLFFCPENPSVSYEKSVSSPQKNRQFNTKKTSVQHTDAFYVLNWRFYVLNWRFCVVNWRVWRTDAFNLLIWRISGAKKNWSWCWTDMFNYELLNKNHPDKIL